METDNAPKLPRLASIQGLSRRDNASDLSQPRSGRKSSPSLSCLENRDFSDQHGIFRDDAWHASKSIAHMWRNLESSGSADPHTVDPVEQAVDQALSMDVNIRNKCCPIVLQ